MELRQIQYFIQLYKDKNITKASKNLFISQQGLSKSINRLEDELGFSLFKRSISGVVPTKEAEKLYVYFEKTLNSYNELVFAIDHLQDNRVLKIFAPYGFALSCQKEDFLEYNKLYPHAETHYEEDYNHIILDHLLSHSADIAFMTAPIPRELTSHQIIWKEPFYAVVDRNHPLAEKKTFHINDLKEQSLLLLDLYYEHNNHLLQQANTSNISYQICGTAKMSSFLNMIHSSPFIGFSSKRIYRHYDFSEIKFIPFSMEDYPDLIIETHLVTLKDLTPDTSIRQYIDYAIEKLHLEEHDEEFLKK